MVRDIKLTLSVNHIDSFHLIFIYRKFFTPSSIIINQSIIIIINKVEIDTNFSGLPAYLCYQSSDMRSASHGWSAANPLKFIRCNLYPVAFQHHFETLSQHNIDKQVF